MPEWHRVTPRTRVDIAAYGRVWPGEGLAVTDAPHQVDTLQRLDGDPRFDVERIADVPTAPAADPDDPPADPKPPSRSRRSGKS